MYTASKFHFTLYIATDGFTGGVMCWTIFLVVFSDFLVSYRHREVQKVFYKLTNEIECVNYWPVEVLLGRFYYFCTETG